MSIDEILNTLPSKEDLAKAIGLQVRDTRSVSLLTALGIFGTGVLLGASLTLLLAPEPDGKSDQTGSDDPAGRDKGFAPGKAEPYVATGTGL